MAKAMSNTVYVYYFLDLIEYNLLRQWRKYVQQRTRGGGAKITIPNLLIEVRELIERDGQNHYGDHASSRPKRHRHSGMAADVVHAGGSRWTWDHHHCQ
ncbi:hypothetical protein DVH05_000010 [Phytophthora capsici]|nr:hypothetical protein DVH05_000010 [Phytophthora capsici]